MNTYDNQNPKTLLKVFIAISTLLLMMNLFQLSQSDYFSVKKKDLKTKNELLDKTMSEAKLEVNKYKGISTELDKLVKEANAKLIKHEQDINKLSGSNAFLKKENIEYARQINEIKNKYINAIDSLLLEEGLNMALENTIKNLEKEVLRLNTKLGVASMFVTDNVIIEPVKNKLSGEYKETAIAKKVDAIRVCFDILENPVAKTGSHEVYLRVISPNAEVLCSENEDDLFVNHPLLDIEVKYSHDETIEYNNEKVSNCIVWQVPESLKPGIYVLELFTDSNMLTTSTFTIK